MVGETLLALFLRAIKKDTDRNEITVVKAPDAKALADIKTDTAKPTADPTTATKQDLQATAAKQDLQATAANQGKEYTLTASDDVLASDLVGQAVSGSTPTKRYQWTLLQSGVVRIKIDLKAVGGGTAYARCYINGIGLNVGDFSTAEITYQSKEDDVPVGEGNLLQIYLWNSSGGYQSWTDNCYICGVSALGAPGAVVES